MLSLRKRTSACAYIHKLYVGLQNGDTHPEPARGPVLSTPEPVASRISLFVTVLILRPGNAILILEHRSTKLVSSAQ